MLGKPQRTAQHSTTDIPPKPGWGGHELGQADCYYDKSQEHLDACLQQQEAPTKMIRLQAEVLADAGFTDLAAVLAWEVATTIGSFCSHQEKAGIGAEVIAEAKANSGNQGVLP